jgi:hypothetical protein
MLSLSDCRWSALSKASGVGRTFRRPLIKRSGIQSALRQAQISRSLPDHGATTRWLLSSPPIGRFYLKQIETESGIWFRGRRRAANHRRALVSWPTPEGLAGMLEVNQDAAAAALNEMPFEFGFPLREYQQAAIKAVEGALAANRRSMLLAMATGTGKTKLAIAMLYRLLATKRFRRICFIVDRSALGEQAAGEFSTTKIVSGKALRISPRSTVEHVAQTSPDSRSRGRGCVGRGGALFPDQGRGSDAWAGFRTQSVPRPVSGIGVMPDSLPQRGYSQLVNYGFRKGRRGCNCAAARRPGRGLPPLG